ncbi:hypothetical protein A2363_05065 [Candidatus Gottesmanbacteria bacterium RIFOXYB1_FULL_47_11]|uniref:Uncharacterized protein n=1 Tax=Candidatus Gottesmanbacteria bacterium RIFOXYB1_FULL_47_11 TaxID=1798401 RepID=A0A1F6BFM9_9BACT|nr:MAG: hypothetical protein A2363_05065 [Candidatus Gottesmanbacteria bacterium RIFOXYB1_FULL_47_11]
MRLNAVKILKISITNASKNEILEEIQKYLASPRKIRQKSLKIFTPNTEQMVFAHDNPGFAAVLNRADISLPDSIGVVLAGRFLTKKPIQIPIRGVEFMEDLVRVAVGRHVPIGLIGGRDNLAVDTLSCLRQKHGKLQDSWAEDGPEISFHNLLFIIHNSDEKLYFERLSRHIVRSGARIIFVALGPPKQEYFVERLARQTPGVIFMVVGGSFDIISGRLPRAPLVIRLIGFEWLWRLILEPRRWRRQLALIRFVWLVLQEKLTSRG